MRRNPSAAVFFCLWTAGCAGTTPSLNHHPGGGLASVLIGGRFILPSGEARTGETWINLEAQGEKGGGEVYRLAVRPGQPLLYQVEPDSYRLAPSRGTFGAQQELMTVAIDDRTYHALFPRAILRKPAVEIKTSKIVSLGNIEVRVKSALPGHEPEVSVWLDDSPDARRKLVEDAIHEMMDPEAPAAYRENAMEWSRALQQTLLDLAVEPPPAKLYKQGNP